jgi:two-component system cell cycle sensor histidine kinase/response regulator CckA
MIHQTAHNLNNQLMVVIGWGDILTSTLADDDERRDAVEAMVAAAQRAAVLTREILAVSKTGEPR